MNELTKQQIERQFDRAAKTYDEVAGLQESMAERLIALLVDLAADGDQKKLVDLGCGTGIALEKIANAKPDWSLCGLDLSSEMLRVAQTRVENAVWFHGDLQQTGLQENKYDCVFSNAAIQWCDLTAALREANRILKPNGHFAFSTFADRTMHQWLAAFETLDSEHQPRVHSFHTAAEIRAEFELAGLVIESIEQFESVVKYNSVDEMFTSIKKLGATNANQNRSRGLLGREKYRLIREYFENELERSGELSLTFDCVYVVGWKAN